MNETASSETLDYPRWIAEALRTVARRALAQVAEEGLPGEHHFFLTFRTRDPGVRLPDPLRDQSEEITIVLQNQFWDLVVDDEAFAVTLTFGGARQRVVVPFAALTAFADPSVPFGLRFDLAPGEVEEGGAEEASEEPEAGTGQGDAPAAAPPSEDGERRGGEVVSLDRFRKKKE
ncbi:MAG TPA: ClpXP protease specificity-enhancing factor SspB [Thermoanaerobaculia bacterium]|nr:ClpXP protease specificity-enhancing factor SspB [Thermoanaerobaculia bacterium]